MSENWRIYGTAQAPKTGVRVVPSMSISTTGLLAGNIAFFAPVLVPLIAD